MKRFTSKCYWNEVVPFSQCTSCTLESGIFYNNHPIYCYTFIKFTPRISYSSFLLFHYLMSAYCNFVSHKLKLWIKIKRGSFLCFRFYVKALPDSCQDPSCLQSDNGKKIWEKIRSILHLKPSELSASIVNNDHSYCRENMTERRIVTFRENKAFFIQKTRKAFIYF